VLCHLETSVWKQVIALGCVEAVHQLLVFCGQDATCTSVALIHRLKAMREYGKQVALSKHNSQRERANKQMGRDNESKGTTYR
jgi:hypothetical protein